MLSRTWLLAVAIAVIATTASAQSVHTPKVGSTERTAIMDAARAAQHVSVKFRVDYLAVVGNANFSLAVADLNDAAGELPVGGLMFFEAINGRWRAIYSLYMDGADNCKETVSISKSIIAKAQDINAPKSFFPPRFYEGYADAVAALAKYKDEDMLSCASTDRY